MSDFTGYVGNTPISFNDGAGGGGSIVSDRAPSGVIKEKKIADALAKMLDTMDLDIPWIVASFTDKGTAMQRRVFDLCLAFMRHWAWRYDTGQIVSSQVLYPYCEKASRMVQCLDADDLDWSTRAAH